MGEKIFRHRARGASWIASIIIIGAWPQVARAQQPPPKPTEDDEAKKLREEADKQVDEAKEKKDQPKRVEGDKTPETKKQDDDAASLRAAADKSSEDDRGLIGRAYSAISERMNEFNPRIVVATDLVGRLACNKFKTIQEGKVVDDRISLREGELDLRADIDPYAKGVFILAIAETDPGKFEPDIEEGYFTLEQLPWQFKLKAGRFRVPFGRMNALHTHDLPQTTRPYALADIFGPDGYNDNGAQLSWLAPGPIPIELSAIILNGENPQMLAQGRSNQPAYMGRGEVFLQLWDTGWLSLGGSFLYGFNDTRGTDVHPHEPRQETELAEGDLLFKWEPSTRQSIVVLAEVYATIKHDRAIAVPTGQVDALGNPITLESIHHDQGIGMFGFIQFQPAQQWYVGVRGDWSNLDDARPDHRQWATSVWLAYYTTEFLRFRVGYEHRERFLHGSEVDLGPKDPSPNDTVFFEVTWVFGSHPAEPFWVNK